MGGPEIPRYPSKIASAEDSIHIKVIQPLLSHSHATYSPKVCLLCFRIYAMLHRQMSESRWRTPLSEQGEMVIKKVKTADEIGRLLRALASEIQDAQIFNRLFKDLDESRKTNYGTEFSQSRTFWSFTFRALDDAIMIRLCRILDNNSKSLNLFNLVETIKANLSFFAKENFKKRLRNNPFVDSLAEGQRMPHKDEVDEHFRFVDYNQNSLVKKLIVWRNNIYAHTGVDVSLGKTNVLEDSLLGLEEIEDLLKGCSRIINYYSRLYTESVYSPAALGQGDYKNLLDSVKFDLQKHREDIDNQIQELEKKKGQRNKDQIP